MGPKDLIWLSICLFVLIFIYLATDASRIFSVNLASVAVCFLLYFLSIVFWIAAWVYLIKEGFVRSFRLNMKALLGVFAPFGLGGDAIRTYFAKKENISPEKALSASFIIKFYKFIMLFFLLLLSMYLFATNSTADYSHYSAIFLSMLFVTIGGAVIVLLFRVPAFAHLLYRLLSRIFIFRFHEQLNEHFIGMRIKDMLVIIILLAVSTFFEIAAVLCAFEAIGQTILLPHLLIFAPIASSLALITITPQGIGFVEAGGYIILSSGYFSLTTAAIGSFLIVWSIIRIWIPSVIGLISFWWSK